MRAFLLHLSLVLITIASISGCSSGGEKESGPENENGQVLIDEEENPPVVEDTAESPFTEGRETVEGAEVWYGFYVDATSYAPGDTIQIYGSAGC